MGAGGYASGGAGIGAMEIKVNDWQIVCALEKFRRLGARVVKSAHGNIAVFAMPRTKCSRCSTNVRTRAGRCRRASCHGRKVTCPLHNWNIQLDDGNAVAPDVGCAQRFETRVENGVVLLKI